MNTDKTWQMYGERDPYYGVLTCPCYHTTNLTSAARDQFFSTGETHIFTLLDRLNSLGFDFEKDTACDFGCGVGRLLIPLATRFRKVVGIDVSPGMLKECHKNIKERNLENVWLFTSDDTLSAIEGHRFALVHSFIVLQHIPFHRGLGIVKRLLECVSPNGVACLHIQYAGLPLAQGFGLKALARRIIKSSFCRFRPESEMLMNAYPLNSIMEYLDEMGFAKCHIEFTKTTKGGVFIWAQKTGIYESSHIF